MYVNVFVNAQLIVISELLMPVRVLNVPSITLHLYTSAHHQSKISVHGKIGDISSNGKIGDISSNLETGQENMADGTFVQLHIQACQTSYL